METLTRSAPPIVSPTRGLRLTERDAEIVRWITRHGVVNAELVGCRFFWRPQLNAYGLRATNRRLRALCRLGLVLDQREFGAPYNIIRATRAGARLADIGIQPAPFVLSELQHSLAVARLAELLAYDHPTAKLTTERELRAQRRRDILAGTRSHGRGRIPDALLTFPPSAEGKTITVALELDLTRKDRRTIESIVREYAYERLDCVWWYVTPARVDRMQQLVRSLGAERRIEVRPWLG